MKRKKALILLVCAITVAAISLYVLKKPNKDEEPSIAIFTTLSHPALNSVREGFIQQIKANGAKVKLIDFNAEANMQQANMLARQISKIENLVGVVAIGTLAAQTMAKVEKNAPIVITAVSDPKVINLQESSNVCGLTDKIDADFQIAQILSLFPHLKKISFLYSPHEDNSSAAVKKLEAAALKRDIQAFLVGVSEPQQIQSASIAACKKGDAVLIPLDNQLVASMPAVIKATKSYDCPIISTNEAPIHEGATLAFGVDYKKMGEKVALVMKDIINNKAPREIGFIDPSVVDLFVNTRAAALKGIKLDGPEWSNIKKSEE